MNTTAFLYSARKGNGYDIAQHFLQKKNIVLLSDFHLLPCSKCKYECLNELPCPVSDDLLTVFNKLKNSNRLLVITPTYDGRPPALFYIWEERLPSLWNRMAEGFEKCYKNMKVYLITIGNSEASETEKIVNAHFKKRNASIEGSILIKPSDYTLGGGIKGGLIKNRELLQTLEPVKLWTQK